MWTHKTCTHPEERSVSTGAFLHAPPPPRHILAGGHPGPHAHFEPAALDPLRVLGASSALSAVTLYSSDRALGPILCQMSFPMPERLL